MHDWSYGPLADEHASMIEKDDFDEWARLATRILPYGLNDFAPVRASFQQAIRYDRCLVCRFARLCCRGHFWNTEKERKQKKRGVERETLSRKIKFAISSPESG